MLLQKHTWFLCSNPRNEAALLQKTAMAFCDTSGMKAVLLQKKEATRRIYPNVWC
jgi:hypothetical protein